jgi:hypothetical protein
MSSNPFTVSSPEMMDASEMLRLFVPLAEDFEIQDFGHVFIHGHRGCGKSMMLRLMAPDCLMLSTAKPLHELPFLGLYATIKSTDLDLSEFDRISNQYAGLVLAEHSLVLFVASKVLQSLRDHTGDALSEGDCGQQLEAFCEKFVVNRLRFSDEAQSASLPKATSTKSSKEVLNGAISAIDEIYAFLTSYLRQTSITESYIPYSGPLVGYRDFLYPLLAELTQLPCMPTGKPVYLLLDDADNLNVLQTQVLNNWVSFRTGNIVSFKISTQRGYKTWRTTTKQRIEAPHDFKEVDISTIFTGKQSKAAYPKWVEEVVTKRLEQHGIQVAAQAFFAPDPKQDAAIKDIAQGYRNRWVAEGKGFRPNDDAYRYARPDYIKSLGPKQQRSYLYAGFEQLVHISSGIIRYFLDNAATMYAEQTKLQLSSGSKQPNVIQQISPQVQDQVVRNSADDLIFVHLDRLEGDASSELEKSGSAQQFGQLRNLILALGGIFQAILFSDRSERRVFSIALSDNPPDEIMEVLHLGVRHGYLYEGSIGTKDGRWRTRRFVMTRRLAPVFKLDPTGFSGYLFVTTQLLQTAILHPARAIREFEQERLGIVVEDVQLALGLES